MVKAVYKIGVKKEMNKGIIFIFSLLLIVFIFIISFDAYLKFDYANSHNNTTFNTTVYNNIPSLIPHIPAPFMNIIFLVIMAILIVGLFLSIYKYAVK